MIIKSKLSIAIAIFMAGVGVARADSYEADTTCCGRVYYSIGPDGSINGKYPKQHGSIVGRIQPNGIATGIWVQPKSDHPCNSPREGSRAWGYFEIRHIGERQMSGQWGYCANDPDRDWGFR